MPQPRHISGKRCASFQFRLSAFVLTLLAGVFYLHATTQNDIELENNFKATFQHLYIAEETLTNHSEVEVTSKLTIPMQHDVVVVSEQHHPSPVKPLTASQRKHSDNTTTEQPLSLKMHFAVSSDCSAYQRWQVLVQIHSARAVGQAGRFSWLISGCTAKEEAKVLSLVADHFPDGSLITHFTPDYSDMSKYGGKFADGKVKRTFLNRHGQLRRSPYGNRYMFNNKPNSVAHWAARTGPAADEMVVLIDPDFLFMNQLVLHSSHESGSRKKTKHHHIGAGFPAAQNYGLGDQFLNFNLTRICGAGSPCTKITSKEVYNFYSAGPPYIIHATDLLIFATEWARLVPLTYDEYPMLYAEMFAYSMAAGQLNLKHALLHGLMSGCMVGWPRSDQNALDVSMEAFVNHDNSVDFTQLQQPTRGAPSCFQAPLSPPPFLHYCQHYSSGFGPSFGKRGVPHAVLECDSPPMDQKELTRSDPAANGKSHDAATGVKHSSSSLAWNALAYCAVTRGIDHARNQVCSPETRKGA